MDWQALFFSPHGRITRKQFWACWAIIQVAGALLGFGGVIGIILGLALTWPEVILFIKRMHDFGRPGWPSAAVAVLSAVSTVAALSAAPAIIQILLFLAYAGFALWVGSSPGDTADNAYGRPPRTLGSAPSATP